MKRIMLSLLVLWAVWAIADTAADYYLPLQVGNRLTYRAQGLGWYPRTVFETIEDTDSLFGTIFYKHVGTEFLDNDPTEELIFHVFWLRDSLGTVWIGAVGMGDSRELDSATIYPQPYPFFHEGYLQPGYCQDTTYMGTRYIDTVVSVNETVSTNAGTFMNCIQRETIRRDSLDDLTWYEKQWHALGIGLIKTERVTPGEHICLLTEFNFQVNTENVLPDQYELGQNYPNPFNPLTTIEYELPIEAYVSIVIYDITGNEITSLVNMNRNAGRHKVIWNAVDVPSGIYIYLLKADYLVQEHGKMCILK
jgi:hypothetical protein